MFFVHDTPFISPSLIAFPYPETHFCNVPIEDQTNHPMCRPLPGTVKPPPPESLTDPAPGKRERVPYLLRSGIDVFLQLSVPMNGFLANSSLLQLQRKRQVHGLKVPQRRWCQLAMHGRLLSLRPLRPSLGSRSGPQLAVAPS